MTKQLNHTEREIQSLIRDRQENADINGYSKSNWNEFEYDLVMEICDKFNLDPDTAENLYNELS